MFELSEFELNSTKHKTLLNQTQGTWQFVRNSGKFELSGIRIKDVYCIHNSPNAVTENDANYVNLHNQELQKHVNHTSIGHLNTRSVFASFPEFQLLMETYSFDFMTLSERLG